MLQQEPAVYGIEQVLLILKLRVSASFSIFSIYEVCSQL